MPKAGPSSAPPPIAGEEPGLAMSGSSRTVKIAGPALALLLVLMISEGLSYLYLRVRIGPLYPIYRLDDALGYFHTSNTHIAYYFREVRGIAQSRHRISINSNGLRDKERSLEKPAGACRTLVLGDSMVFAHQIPQERRFTDTLEAKLNAQAKGARYEVINAGVNGYGTDLEVLLFEHEAFRYAPDLVILSFYVGNDIMENSRELLRRASSHFMNRPYFTIEKDRLALRNSPVQRSLLMRSSLYRVALNELGTYLPGLVRRMNRFGLLENGPLHGEYVLTGLPLHLHIFKGDDEPEWVEAWRITKGLVARLRDDAARQGARFLLLMIPDKLQIGNPVYWESAERLFPGVSRAALDMMKPNRILRAWLSENEIPFLDLLPGLQAYERGGGGPVYFTVDPHLNEEGHRVVSDILVDFLRGHGHLCACPDDRLDRPDARRMPGAAGNGRSGARAVL